MIPRRTLGATLLWCVIGSWLGASAQAERYACFSLARARDRIESGSEPDSMVLLLGRLTRLIGVVHDLDARDLILIGRRDPRRPDIRLDDFVVALRVVYRHPDVRYPGLSIDPDPEDAASRRQKVRYVGGIEDSRLGQVCFSADTLLKAITQGRLPTGSPEVVGPWEMLSVARQDESDTTAASGTRTFFYPIAFNCFAAGPAAILQTDRIILDVQTIERGARNPIQEEFARSMSRHYEEIGRVYPLLEQLRNAMSAYAIARALPQLRPPPDLGYWLDRYRPALVPTPRAIAARTRGVRGLATSVVVTGAIEMRVLVQLLEAGDPIALHTIALASRPPGEPLAWSFDVEAGSVCYGRDATEATAGEQTDIGRFLALRGRWRDSVQPLTDAIAGSADPDLLLLRARSLGRSGHHETARQDMAEARARGADPTALLLTEASILMDQEQWDGAGNLLRVAVRKTDSIGSTCVAESLLDEILSDRSGVALDREVLVELTRVAPRSGMAWLLLGDRLRAEKRPAETRAAYERAYRLSREPRASRRAYTAILELDSESPPSVTLPKGIEPRRSHNVAFSLDLLPAMQYAQVVSPARLRSRGYYRQLAASLATGAGIVFSDRIGIQASVEFQSRMIDVWTFRSKTIGSDTTEVVFVSSTPEISAMVGSARCDLRWLWKTGYLEGPYVLAAVENRWIPRDRRLMAIQPLKIPGYILATDGTEQERVFSSIGSLYAELPVRDRHWLEGSLSYGPVWNSGFSDEGGANLGLRLPLVSRAREGILLRLGGSYRETSPFRRGEHDGSSATIYAGIYRSRRDRMEAVVVGLVDTSPNRGEHEAHLFATVQLYRRLVSLDHWFGPPRCR